MPSFDNSLEVEILDWTETKRERLERELTIYQNKLTPEEQYQMELFMERMIMDRNGRFHDSQGRFANQTMELEELPEYPTLMERLEQLRLVSEYMKKENEHTYIKKYRPTLLTWSIIGFFTYCLLVG